MPYSKFSLPEYPVREDVWDSLAAETRPIVVYGMGNGADKLLSRFAEYGIRVADFFASDGFVRGHSFHGFRVKSFSEIRETYPDFRIVLSFASNRPEVISALAEIDRAYDLVAPDMPVAGGEYFDRAFYNAHYGEILRAYELFSDEDSRSAFAAAVRYRLTGRISYLLSAFSPEEEIFSHFYAPERYLDVGAYRGDTVRSAVLRWNTLREIVAVEPDSKNFARLAAYAGSVDSPKILPVEGAAYSENGEGCFSEGGNRNSSLLSASYRHKDRAVRLLRLDSLPLGRVDLIKYDVEGAEREALEGSEALILRDRPQMLVSLYHRSADLFKIPLALSRKYPFYRFLLRRAYCLPAWEIDLICIPERKNE